MNGDRITSTPIEALLDPGLEAERAAIDAQLAAARHAVEVADLRRRGRLLVDYLERAVGYAKIALGAIGGAEAVGGWPDGERHVAVSHLCAAAHAADLAVLLARPPKERR